MELRRSWATRFGAVGDRKVPASVCAKDKASRSLVVYAAVDAKFLVPCGVYDCITARDIQHTLTSRNDGGDQIPFHVDKSVKPWRYRANFAGIRSDEKSFCTASPFKHSDGSLVLVNAVPLAGFNGQFTNQNRLVVGNLNDDTFIDIDDFGIFSARLGKDVVALSCEFKPFHADTVPDHQVNLLDFGTIATNFLLISETPCCPFAAVAAAKTEPRTSITVAELRAQGRAAEAAGDLNHDGVLDVADMEAFAAGVRPVRVAGDLDADGDVDMADYMAFQACFGGNGNPSGSQCLTADLDDDKDIDLADLVAFQAAFTGAR